MTNKTHHAYCAVNYLQLFQHLRFGVIMRVQQKIFHKKINKNVRKIRPERFYIMTRSNSAKHL